MTYRSTIFTQGKSSVHTNPQNLPQPRTVGTPWVRNPSWLAMPTVLPTEDKIVILYGVYSDLNGIAFICTTVGAATYVVDWGDGTSNTYASAATANHQYDYSNVNLGTNAPATLSTTTNLVTRSNHGYTDGQQVRLYDVVGPTTIDSGGIYYVINATTDTFQIADSTLSLTPISFNVDGTAALLPYKQALITVTVSGGAQFLAFKPCVQPTSIVTTTSGGYTVSMLDVLFSGTKFNSINFSNSPATSIVKFGLIERVQMISNNAITAYDSAFVALYSLQQVNWVMGTNTTTGAGLATSMSLMFNQCFALQYAPVLNNTENVTTIASMFYQCYNLVYVPSYNTSKVTAFNNMFQACFSLTVPPYLDTSTGTAFTQMFATCYGLTTVPLYNLRKASDVSLMFTSCFNLVTIPNFQISLDSVATTRTAASMFASCVSLQTVPALDLSKIKDASNMFDRCSSLVSIQIDTLNMASCTTAAQMFTFCSRIPYIPSINLPVCSTTTSMFEGCYSLAEIGELTFGATGIGMGSMFNTCTALKSVRLIGTGSPGSTGPTFQSCASLQYVFMSPSMATSTSANTFNSLYQGTVSLRETTVLNLSACAVDATLIYNGVPSLRVGGVTGMKYSLNISPTAMDGPTFTNAFLKNLGQSASINTKIISISSNYASGLASPAVTTTSGSKTATCTSTTGVEVGMWVGSGMNNASGGWTPLANVSADVASSTFTYTAHGLDNGTKVAFVSTSTVTGVSIYTIYYIVNSTTNTYQVSLTSGGAAITLGGTNASIVSMGYECYVTAVVANTSITFSTPARTSTFYTSGQLALRRCDVSWAYLRGFLISG